MRKIALANSGNNFFFFFFQLTIILFQVTKMFTLTIITLVHFNGKAPYFPKKKKNSPYFPSREVGSPANKISLRLISVFHKIKKQMSAV